MEPTRGIISVHGDRDMMPIPISDEPCRDPVIITSPVTNLRTQVTVRQKEYIAFVSAREYSLVQDCPRSGSICSFDPQIDREIACAETQFGLIGHINRVRPVKGQCARDFSSRWNRAAHPSTGIINATCNVICSRAHRLIQRPPGDHAGWWRCTLSIQRLRRHNGGHQHKGEGQKLSKVAGYHKYLLLVRLFGLCE